MEQNKAKRFIQITNMEKQFRRNQKIKFTCEPIRDLDSTKKKAYKEVQKIMNRKLEKLRKNSQEI